ncbi:MAG TPA: thioredoxin family protein [Longimicrobiales bacterium]|nr:thioredoxin family protein [Longimicrobiales bacterium]
MDEPMLDLDALEALTDPEQVRALEGPLAHLEKDTDILLFMSPGCAVCPHQLRSVATVMLASPRVGLEVVDASLEPELAARYEVRAVPTTVVDDELIMVGVVPPAELALRLVERQGPEGARVVFASLLEAGRLADAAERLADGRGTAAFLELWARSGPEQRPGLRRVALEALLYDPEGLGGLVAGLEAGLEDGPLATDDDRRADTADLLARLGGE